MCNDLNSCYVAFSSHPVPCTMGLSLSRLPFLLDTFKPDQCKCMCFQRKSPKAGKNVNKLEVGLCYGSTENVWAFTINPSRNENCTSSEQRKGRRPAHRSLRCGRVAESAWWPPPPSSWICSTSSLWHQVSLAATQVHQMLAGSWAQEPEMILFLFSYFQS